MSAVEPYKPFWDRAKADSRGIRIASCVFLILCNLVTLVYGARSFSGLGSVNEDRMAFYTVLGGFDAILAPVILGLVVHSYKTEGISFALSKGSISSFSYMLWLIAGNEARRMGTIPSGWNRTAWISASVVLLAATTWFVYLCIKQPLHKTGPNQET